MPKMLLDVLDKDGIPTGELSDIVTVHQTGQWHRSAHLWIVNSKGQILLQKRSATVINKPNLWHVSSSGHLDAGEDSMTAIIRESKEELGLIIDPKDFILIKQFKDFSNDSCPGKINNEFVDIFLLRKDIDPNALMLCKEEVAEVKFIDLADLKKMVENRDPSLAPLWEKFKFIINYLEMLQVDLREEISAGESLSVVF